YEARHQIVLGARQRVEIDDRVQAMSGAPLDGPVEQSEPVVPELERAHVVLEMPVVHREADEVEPERSDERRVGVREEHVEETSEEPSVALLSEGLLEGRALKRF